MADLRMAVIGVGHLGKEHARILAGLRGVKLVGVADVNAEQAQAVAQRVGTKAYADHRDLLSQVDAATIVVPTTYHYQVACDFLNLGIPLLMEKPLARTLAEAEELAELAEHKRTLLQVGHIERFNPAFEELQQHSMRPKFIQAERIGPFTGRSTDIGVVLDLMIHDLDLLLTLVNSPVKTVEALGVSLFGEHEDVANARLHFADGCVADVTASRASPQPARRMHIWSAEGYASVDFKKRHLSLVQPAPHLRGKRPDARHLDPRSLLRLKDEMFSRHLQSLQLDCNHGDQLTRELEHFIHCVSTGLRPRVSGADGLKALALADRVQDSLNGHRWEGRTDGPVGPRSLPRPLGPLFHPLAGSDAAA